MTIPVVKTVSGNKIRTKLKPGFKLNTIELYSVDEHGNMLRQFRQTSDEYAELWFHVNGEWLYLPKDPDAEKYLIKYEREVEAEPVRIGTSTVQPVRLLSPREAPVTMEFTINGWDNV